MGLDTVGMQSTHTDTPERRIQRGLGAQGARVSSCEGNPTSLRRHKEKKVLHVPCGTPGAQETLEQQGRESTDISGHKLLRRQLVQKRQLPPLKQHKHKGVRKAAHTLDGFQPPKLYCRVLLFNNARAEVLLQTRQRKTQSHLRAFKMTPVGAVHLPALLTQHRFPAAEMLPDTT